MKNSSREHNAVALLFVLFSNGKCPTLGKRYVINRDFTDDMARYI